MPPFILILFFGLVLGFGLGFYSGVVAVDNALKENNIVCYQEIIDDKEVLQWVSEEFNIYNIT